MNKLLLLIIAMVFVSCAQTPSRKIASVATKASDFRTISSIEDPDLFEENIHYKDSDEE